MQMRRGRGGGAFRSQGRGANGSSARFAAAALVDPRAGDSPAPDSTTPDWHSVERLLAFLAATGAAFPTPTSPSTCISDYEPGRRLMVETGAQTTWVQVEHLRSCWETFERLGRIRRRDVLEPGRCSAFVVGLFAQLPGVRVEHEGEHEGEEPYLVLTRAAALPTER